MRVGDFGVEVVPHTTGRVRELESGQVLARPGQVYRLRLRNYGPLYCVVDVDIDGERVTGGGLVLAPWSSTDLEHPIGAGEGGRFTVVAEGDERVFGPDGGRDDDQLGLVVASFRRELPGNEHRTDMPPSIALPMMPLPGRPGMPPVPEPRIPEPPRRFPTAPPEWTPPRNFRRPPAGAAIERAAGTGLTGHSDQEFEPFELGPLEAEATVLRLRIVIGSQEAIDKAPARPVVEQQVPPRPAARP